jgi:Ala-tRNA(Pro) deacylase
MTVAPILARHLANQNIKYDVIAHEPTMTSSHTAQACHISGDRVVKGIVLRGDGVYTLAVLPASRRIRMTDLKARISPDVALASEAEIDRLFRDCVLGAVPPVGPCYGLDVIVDDSIQEQPDVYLEGGDHVTLIHMSSAQFARLTAGAPHGRFSVHMA